MFIYAESKLKSLSILIFFKKGLAMYWLGWKKQKMNKKEEDEEDFFFKLV